MFAFVSPRSLFLTLSVCLFIILPWHLHTVCQLYLTLFGQHIAYPTDRFGWGTGSFPRGSSETLLTHSGASSVCKCVRGAERGNVYLISINLWIIIQKGWGSEFHFSLMNGEKYFNLCAYKGFRCLSLSTLGIANRTLTQVYTMACVCVWICRHG